MISRLFCRGLAMAGTAAAATAVVPLLHREPTMAMPPAFSLLEIMHHVPLDTVAKLSRRYSDEQKQKTINKADFIEVLAKDMGITNKAVAESFFGAFDKDSNGCVDFREFVSALVALQGTSTSPADQAKTLFAACDLDGNGEVTRAEMEKTLGTLCSLLCKKVFLEADTNRDDKLTLDEFNSWVDSDGSGATSLKSLFAVLGDPHIPLASMYTPEEAHEKEKELRAKTKMPTWATTGLPGVPPPE